MGYDNNNTSKQLIRVGVSFRARKKGHETPANGFENRTGLKKTQEASEAMQKWPMPIGREELMVRATQREAEQTDQKLTAQVNGNW